MIKSRRMRCEGHVSRMGKMINWFNILVGKPEGKRKPIRIWEDIRMDLRGIGREDADWMHLAEDRDQWLALVNTVMNLSVS
jgi:hypothetical protein